MAMIEPISWDLIEEKVHPPLPLPAYMARFNMKHAVFAPIWGLLLFQNETKWAFFASY
jgi:hypothetical protein